MSKKKDKEEKKEKSLVEEVKKAEKEIEKKVKKEKKEKKETKEDDFASNANLIIPVDDYRKAGVYIGTRVITAFMKPYVYRRKADGLAIINIEKTDEKLNAAINMLSQFAPQEILFVCKREAGWKALEKTEEVLGCKIFTKQYPAGVITNPALENFFEPKIIVVVDPWLDKKAIKDGILMNVPIISLCDTNNITHKVDLVIPTNNKSNKSIGLIFYVLIKGYLENKGMKKEAKELKIEDFS